jgi:hypothetical protein
VNDCQHKTWLVQQRRIDTEVDLTSVCVHVFLSLVHRPNTCRSRCRTGMAKPVSSENAWGCKTPWMHAQITQDSK